MTREVSCPPVLPDEGEAAVDCEREGECRASREIAAALLPPPWEGLARVDARRGLLAEVTARDRLPLRMPPTCAEPEGEASELVEEVDDCLLVPCLLAASAA